jgi:hypothetical protein
MKDSQYPRVSTDYIYLALTIWSALRLRNIPPRQMGASGEAKHEWNRVTSTRSISTVRTLVP